MPQSPLSPVQWLLSRLRQITVFVLALNLLGAAWAQDKPVAPYALNIVGGLAGLHQFTRNEEPFWTQTLPRLSGGQFTAEIVPFDRTGVPGGDMLRLIQLGVVPFGTVLLSSASAQYPKFGAPDLVGLNPDIASLKRNVAAFRPYLEMELRTKHNIHALAVYVYPAQVIFCKKAMTGLADLSGRRIRVSSISQSDFVSALGAVPVLTGFAQIKSLLMTDQLDCAITGAMSGNTIGLHELTTHVYSMPINWGLAIFGANSDAWVAMPPELRALLGNELPKLERAIWAESERETLEGLACNVGGASCQSGQRGKMIAVPHSPKDEARRRALFVQTILPKWLQRCNHCAEVWNRTVGPVENITAPTSP
jgi:TRAP-type C4-dicarboxylate transport system substrate-binding protein